MVAVRKPPVPHAGVEHGLAPRFFRAQAGIDAVHHEFGDCPRSVELAGIAGAAQVVEDLLVDVAELAAGLEVVVVDGFFQLLDDAQHQGAGLHVVVGVDEDLADHLGGGISAEGQVLELGENGVVDVADQLVGRDLRLAVLVRGPVAPAAVLRDGGAVGTTLVAGVVLPAILALVEDLQEEHPGQLADALGVAVDAVVLAHDVLDGFDGGAEIHGVWSPVPDPAPVSVPVDAAG
jgi:hypothetical protein